MGTEEAVYIMCSTPSGITARGTSAWWRDDTATVVLNAFRHHSKRNICGMPICMVPICSAQRLPASQQEEHGADDVEQAYHMECSTPSGITARGTRRRGPAGAARGRVLNAFRHHSKRNSHGSLPTGRRNRKCSTPSGITARGTCTRFGIPVLARCAQRLPASQQEEPLSLRLLLLHLDVLNAFRHHSKRNWECARLVGIRSASAQRLPASQQEEPARWNTDAREFLYVLNAFRHHSKRNTSTTFSDSPQWTCSTPSGITARGTGARRPPRCDPRLVLNAFRHHSKRNVRDDP